MARSNWYKQNFFSIAAGLCLILLIIFLTIQLSPILNVVLTFITALLFPIIIAGVLYYILRPVCQHLEKRGIPRILSISFIYVTIFILISLGITYIWPTISKEIDEFTSTPSQKLQEVENKTVAIMNFFNFTSLTHEQLRSTLMFYLQKIVSIISENLTFTISSAAKIASYFIITPFLLFYFLKDDKKTLAEILRITPTAQRKTAKKILSDLDDTLSSYITSQVLVAAIVAVLIFIGYYAIGLNYAFLLALIAFIFNLIPFCGPIISTIPALMIGLSNSPFMAFKVLCVVSIVHLLDLNLISPRIVGPRLNIHPVTIILLLVASLPILGFLGLFFIVPLYAVLKTLLNDLYQINAPPEQES